MNLYEEDASVFCVNLQFEATFKPTKYLEAMKKKVLCFIKTQK